MLANILLQIQETSNIAVQTVAQTEKTMNVIELAIKGGWIMIVLAILSIVAVYIFVDRYIALNKATKEDKGFINNIKAFIHKGRDVPGHSFGQHIGRIVGRMYQKAVYKLFNR